MNLRMEGIFLDSVTGISSHRIEKILVIDFGVMEIWNSNRERGRTEIAERGLEVAVCIGNK